MIRRFVYSMLVFSMGFVLNADPETTRPGFESRSLAYFDSEHGFHLKVEEHYKERAPSSYAANVYKGFVLESSFTNCQREEGQEDYWVMNCSKGGEL